MLFDFLGKFFDSNESEIKKLQPLIDQINELSNKTKKLKDEDFPKQTQKLKKRLAKGESLDDLLVEAFALVREASYRVIGERHFDVQLISGIVLHQGKVAEQKTGEGKTLSATAPLYLNALFGKGVHLVTVNDYLARRDAGWMGNIFHFLGLSTTAIISGQQFIFDPEHEDKEAQDWRLRNLRPITRMEAYKADVTYGINSEFGFDYLRDNMARKADDIVQKQYNYAIIDEVDSVLIDEARTPHIISAPDSEPTQKYYQYADLAKKLSENQDYEIDEKSNTANLTEHGVTKVEKWLGVDNLFEKDYETLHHIEASLKASALYKRDTHYIVREGQVIIVDEFTGRLLEGRRFSEGIHQAIEAKEGVQIQRESKTLATVSLQNYFRMYDKLAGMTGTAATEAEEFHKIYDLDVVIIPTNQPIIRDDQTDLVYKTVRAKYAAVAKDIEERHAKGQPVLVGTTSIEHNETISKLLKHKKVPHTLLNAKNHAQEAQIISDAGKVGAVTVATNMAGRGVDIVLGGMKPDKYEYQKFIGDESYRDNPEYNKRTRQAQEAHDEVLKLGGLHVIGTERHESRRIDNQLRGRSGRQGDPGSTIFFVSLQDQIMRIFGGDQVAGLMTRFKLPEDQPLQHGLVSRAIEQSQTKVEGFNFDIRKRLVEYDDVLNRQREIIYGRRLKILNGEVDTNEQVYNILINEVTEIATQAVSEDEKGQDKLPSEIVKEFSTILPIDDASSQKLANDVEGLSDEGIARLLLSHVDRVYKERKERIGEEIMKEVEQWVTLSVIDSLWMNHIDSLTELREGIGLRGYAQKDPLVEYKNEAFRMFEQLLASVDFDIARRILRVDVKVNPTADTAITKAAEQAQYSHEQLGQFSQPKQSPKGTLEKPSEQPKKEPVAKQKAPGRNDPCPCGSGKKYKKCHYPEYG
ncbi:preprotein translocase subunit SecA [Candidatus Roizmanbacteria bacterium CG_4_9_14_0_2_um_filter_38_17]|nr:preprotein translocase subunit SecA [Candidatus Microgenomates bacterium]PJC30984.1 MAG: preprotein translocase subunit SecA [Candidatus Roizmanbacteria bacterium CG_4_9_14_0_2_um_filter_38_17]